MKRLLSTGLNAGSETVVEVTGGQGAWFELSNGRRVLDGSNSAGVLGHAHPEMVEAVRAAAGHPAVSEGWAYRDRELAAEDLIDIAFEGETSWVGAVRFGLSGSEINDLALSLAQAVTGRAPIATRERAYHGLVGLSRDVTVQPHWHGGLSRMTGGVAPAAPTVETRVISAPTGSLWGERVQDLAPMSPDAVRATLDGTAAVIVDYTQGGIYHDAAWQDATAAAARDTGSLWIADEVVTGAGRSGRWFAFQGGKSRPDIVTMGKSLAGGASPIGAVILSQEMVERMGGSAWQAYSTFRGHPLAMAGVRTYLKIVKRDGLLDRANQLAALIGPRLVEIAKKHPSVSRVDGRGMHWTIELHGPHWRDWRADTAATPLASRVSGRAFDNGVIIGTSGEETSLFLAPPLIVSDAEMHQILDALDDALDLADAEFARTAG
ncbi:aminotransferase class III-fold pyridoxal phosphate-dependent enzyme [Frigidibacter sp. MR17.14]|uniref:aminotransferase class III-fold pyridoxal phosphate-dependent enzyme n=1 Tax=Frigidibacter sp. MR17.14 TaxID=3126509 RepID=UPI003012D93E